MSPLNAYRFQRFFADLGHPIPRPLDPIAQHLPPEVVREAALQGLPEAFGDADGTPVLRADEADHPAPLPAGEGALQGGPRPLGGIAEAPAAARQHPGQLEPGPAFRLRESDHAEERAALLVLHRPRAGAREQPVAADESQVPPGPPPIPRLPSAPEMAHDLGVRVQRGVVVEVARAQRPQPQTFRFQDGSFDLHGDASSRRAGVPGPHPRVDDEISRYNPRTRNKWLEHVSRGALGAHLLLWRRLYRGGDDRVAHKPTLRQFLVAVLAFWRDR